MFTCFSFTRFDGLGTEKPIKGVYLIVDGATENGMKWGAEDGLFEDDPDANYSKLTIRACSGSGSSESSIGCMSSTLR